MAQAQVSKSSKSAAAGAAARKANKVATKPARRPAKELMAERRRMFFGAAYLNAVLAGVHRDHDKMLHHAIHLKIDQPAKLKKLKLETLREKLATAIMERPDGAVPFSIKLQ